MPKIINADGISIDISDIPRRVKLVGQTDLEFKIREGFASRRVFSNDIVWQFFSDADESCYCEESDLEFIRDD